MSAVSFVDAACNSVFQSVRNDRDSTNWVAYKYQDRSKTKLELRGKGDGGLDELKTTLPENDVNYCVVRTLHGDAESRRAKFIFISWIGEGCPPLRRARVSMHKGAVEALLPGCHVSMHATDLDDLDEKEVMGKVRKAMGSDYDAQRYTSLEQREQAEGSSPAPTAAPARVESKPVEKKEEPVVEKKEEPVVEEKKEEPVVEEKKEEEPVVEEKKEEEPVVEEKKEEPVVEEKKEEPVVEEKKEEEPVVEEKKEEEPDVEEKKEEEPDVEAVVEHPLSPPKEGVEEKLE